MIGLQDETCENQHQQNREEKKMKKNLTEMVFILDKSGSMQGLEQDTIGGFNSMIEKQRAEKGEALVSTVLFANESAVLHDRVDIQKVEPMTERQYFVGGCTALIDAMGGAIHHIGNIHKYAREEDVPEHKYGWEFLFLGANIDAVETAAEYGIHEERAVTFRNDHRGQRLNYDTVSKSMSRMRHNAPLKADWKAEIEKDMKERR